MSFNYFLARGMRYCIRKYPSPTLYKFIRYHFRKWCPADEILTSTQEGFNIFASPRDYASFGIYFLGEYDGFMTNFMKAHIVEGNVCWDIGTERGWFTLLMANLVGKTGRVDSFEAFSPNFVKLKNNIDLNGFEWVNANNVAVSDSTGKMFFVPPTDEVTHYVGYLQDCGGVGYLTKKATLNSIVVPTVSLDEYAENHPLKRLDFIKLDIEGAEYVALSGAKNIISKYRPKIVVEYNRETALRAGSSIEEVDALLNDMAYDRYTFRGKLEELYLENWKDKSDNEAVFNVYCLPRN